MERDLLTFIYLFIVSVVRSEEFFNTTPQPINSNFTCTGRLTGYYADLPSNCRIYHNCDDQGNKFSYHCPEMTAFRQDALICDHAYLVDCKAGNRLITKVEKTLNTSEQSPGNRWTTAVPFRDFLLGKNSGINVGSRKSGWPADVSFKNSETHSAFFRLGTTDSHSHILSSSLGKDLPPKRSETISRNDWRQTLPQRQLEPPFAGSIFSKQINRNNEDNEGIKFQTEKRREESTTTQCICKDGQQPTETHFTFQKGVYSSSERVNSKSIQPFTRQSPTTPMTPLTSETPSRDFTASLEPLVPNELEYDPYYPKEPWTTTETYYTPSEKGKIPKAFNSPNFQPPLVGIYFKIPDVLPDLNTLDDIVDRRRLFYIPKTNRL